MTVNRSNSEELEESLSRLLLPAILGISVFFALALWLERSSLAARRHWIGLAAGTVVLGIFWLSYRQDSPQIYIYRFCQLALAAHLLVAVAPFQRRGDVAAFWEFNRILFQRILQAVLFSSILYAGLAIALWAVQSLLGLKVDGKAYYFLFLAVAFLFNTWFFLAGIPSNWRELEVDYGYPSGLRMFVQFILLPLVTLYVLILYSYLVKILIVQEWPRGTIGWLVSIVAVFGMLALLLVHPLRGQPGHRWIHLYSRLFYAGLFPLVVLLLMAIWRRVSEYGLTEDRYFLTMLTLWMTGIAVYFTFRRQPSIKVIPVSLALLALLTVAGPWGPYALSRHDQTSRLRARLERLGILKDRRVQKALAPVEFKDRNEISALVRYLVDMHGVSSLQPWFDEDLKRRLEKDVARTRSGLFSRNTYAQAKAITGMMGVAYLDVWQHSADPKHFSANAPPLWNEVRSIAGYDYLSRFNLFRTNGGTASTVISIGASSYELFWGPDVQSVGLRLGKEPLVTLEMGPFLKRLQQQTAEGSNTGLSEEVLSLEGESASARIKLRFESVSGTRDSSGIRLNNAHGELLLKLKEREAGR
ncbi:MAG: DUF4153 domain-containing protein [Acidobacteria bacterium]|nr:DUF4153 domain-containing protein [Acidobacteriota bacterium]